MLFFIYSVIIFGMSVYCTIASIDLREWTALAMSIIFLSISIYCLTTSFKRL